MVYHLNRALFVENGPPVLAERRREALAVSHAYQLLGKAAEGHSTVPVVPPERVAA